jgi:hypothetical protein
MGRKVKSIIGHRAQTDFDVTESDEQTAWNRETGFSLRFTRERTPATIRQLGVEPAG